MSKIVAIINVTPDSFSDGGQYITAESALNAIHQVVQSGADIIDIGAESTRPGATALSHEEEWARLEPVLTALDMQSLTISVDTRHAQTARKALALGVQWINDVSGFSDPAMIEAVRHSDCRLVAMHSLTVPADKNTVLPEGCDVISELVNWARECVTRLAKEGIALERIILDPGLGFGKTSEQSWQIIEGIERLQKEEIPLLVGHSRKSFLGGDLAERNAKTLTLSKQLSAQGIAYLRVHDVVAHVALQKAA